MTTGHAPITPADAEVLAFERLTWPSGRPGEKVAGIRAWFGCSETEYYARLQRIITTPAALEYDPELVRRLLRIQTQRAARRPGGWATTPMTQRTQRTAP